MGSKLFEGRPKNFSQNFRQQRRAVTFVSAKYQLASLDSVERRAKRLIGDESLVDASVQSLEHRRLVAFLPFFYRIHIAINIVREYGSNMNIVVESTRICVVEKLLRERNIKFNVIGTDNGPINLSRLRSSRSSLSMTRFPQNSHSTMARMERGIRSASNRSMLRLSSPTKFCLDWRDYYPLNLIYNWMDEIEKQYPATCTVCAIGKSVEGRDIKMLKISNSDASNTCAWLDGTIHAREWISTSVVTYIADYIARNFSNLPVSITNKDWYFVPVVNPDGYHYTHTTDRLWRKNRSRFGNTIVGVDLNRNFGLKWGQSGADVVSTGDPTHNNFRGLEPFSEPESSAIKDLILYSGTPFKIFLTFHAYSEVISFPWCFTSDACPDYVNLLEGGATMAKAMYDTTGRMYKVGNFKDIMYYAAGTSIDWSYGTARIPFSYLVELRSKEHRFLLPKQEILDCCREALSGVLALANFVETRKCMNCTVFVNKVR